MISQLTAAFKPLGDLERLTNRILGGTAQPRDLVAARDTLRLLPSIKGVIPSETEALVDAARFTGDQRDALEVLLALGENRPDAERWLARAAALHPDLVDAEACVRAVYRIKAGVEG